MKRNWIFAVVVLLFASCEHKADKKTFDFFASPPVDINLDDIKVEGNLGVFDIDMEQHSADNGIRVITIRLSAERAARPPEFTLKWSFPSVDVNAFWNSNIGTDKATYYHNRVTSRASSQAPVLCFMNSRDRNRLTLALSDALNKIATSSYLREEDIRFHCAITFFSEPHPAIREYTVELRLDSRDIPFYDALNDVSAWWSQREGYTPAYVPDMARVPLYSTWYSFHQNLDAGEVVRQCRLGKDIGLDAVIIDDGWQTLDNRRGYAYTGDWEPERIPEMKAFVDSIHALGMKVMLWYSLPFIGEKSMMYNHFKGRYLHHWESQDTWVLDPRYPGVREHIIGTYEKALADWGLDGFKLDFLGWFYADENTVLTASDGRDYASVNEAVDRLMTDIMLRLKQIRPDILIEFRQPYIGPLMRKYGNMFRAADCPNMEIVNRVRTTDLRLLSGGTAVHSDMFRWHADDPVESAALQIQNILFSVPQLSVKLDSVPEEHVRMAAFWMGYWKENKGILLDGKFVPHKPAALYPLIAAHDSVKMIAAVYNDMVLQVNGSGLKALDVINAKGSTTVYVDWKQAFGKASILVFDCIGNLQDEYEATINKEVRKFAVPPSGLMAIKQHQ
jgi:alpha-galactosidase